MPDFNDYVLTTNDICHENTPLSNIILANK